MEAVLHAAEDPGEWSMPRQRGRAVWAVETEKRSSALVSRCEGVARASSVARECSARQRRGPVGKTERPGALEHWAEGSELHLARAETLSSGVERSNQRLDTTEHYPINLCAGICSGTKTVPTARCALCRSRVRAQQVTCSPSPAPLQTARLSRSMHSSALRRGQLVWASLARPWTPVRLFDGAHSASGFSHRSAFRIPSPALSATSWGFRTPACSSFVPAAPFSTQFVATAPSPAAHSAGKSSGGKQKRKKDSSRDERPFAAVFEEHFGGLTAPYVDTHCHIDLILQRANEPDRPLTGSASANSVNAAGAAEMVCCAAPASAPPRSSSEPLAAAWTAFASTHLLGPCDGVVTVCCDVPAIEPLLALLDQAAAASAPASPTTSPGTSPIASPSRHPASVPIWGAFGLHPHNAKEWNDEVEARFVAAMAHPRVRAWGECGLDFHYSMSPHDVQRTVFARQMDLAVAMGKPLVVHSREADADTYELMTKHLPKDHVIHLHWYVRWFDTLGIATLYCGFLTWASPH